MSLSAQAYQQLILVGIRELPAEQLAEVANFVLFLRRQAADPEAFVTEQYALLLQQDLHTLDADEAAHLEAEIAGYETAFPHFVHCRPCDRTYGSSLRVVAAQARAVHSAGVPGAITMVSAGPATTAGSGAPACGRW